MIKVAAPFLDVVALLSARYAFDDPLLFTLFLPLNFKYYTSVHFLKLFFKVRDSHSFGPPPWTLFLYWSELHTAALTISQILPTTEIHDQWDYRNILSTRQRLVHGCCYKALWDSHRLVIPSVQLLRKLNGMASHAQHEHEHK